MTGPEHYRKAEALLADAERYSRAGAGVGEMVSVAQVHATLALAAATGLTRERVLPLADYKAWSKAAGEKHEEGS